MKITVNQLHKLLGKQIAQGNGRLPVLIDKPTFNHVLESDGCVLLEVCGLGIQRVPIIDGDGHTATTKAGLERSQRVLLLAGGDGADMKGNLVPPSAR